MKRYFKPVAKASAAQPSLGALKAQKGSAAATPASRSEAERNGGMAERDVGMAGRDGGMPERDEGMADGLNAGGEGAGERETTGGAKRVTEDPPEEDLSAAACIEEDLLIGGRTSEREPADEQQGGERREQREQTEQREQRHSGDQSEQRRSAKGSEPPQEEASAHQEPLRIMSWNANSLLLRLRHNRAELVGFICKHDPDVIAIQEVRMAAAGRKGAPLNQSELKDDTKQAREERQFLQHALASAPFSHYRVWWSLAPTKYAGTAMLLKRSLLSSLSSVSFSLDASAITVGGEQRKQQRPQHEADGRAILLDFPSLRLLNTYVPNNGFAKNSPSFPRRREWDDRIRRFLTSDAARSKPLIWLGDLNVSVSPRCVFQF
ncbi:hypothetical protein CLOM_g5948 [Closterium sp. NIES-68]|nr:hypothetical protein CLOM_g5948 [Closterium sp. NIES-68]